MKFLKLNSRISFSQTASKKEELLVMYDFLKRHMKDVF
jgi:hypothetical protein